MMLGGLGTVRGSDEESFREFVAARWVPLQRTAFLLVSDRGHAEDLVAVVFSKLWFVWPRVRDEAPDAYTRRRLVNAATSWRRRRWHGELPTGDLPNEVGMGDDTGRVDDRLLLRAALGTLTARQRAAVVLRFAEDLSEPEVAALLRCSVGTVKSLTSRGLARIRQSGRSGLTTEVENGVGA